MLCSFNLVLKNPDGKDRKLHLNYFSYQRVDFRGKVLYIKALICKVKTRHYAL